MSKTFYDIINSQIDVTGLTDFLKENFSAEVNIPVGAYPFILQKMARTTNCFYIAFDEIEAEEIYSGLKSIGCQALFFPDIDAIPYSNVFPSQDKLSDRIRTLFYLSFQSHMVTVLTAESFLRKLPPKVFFDSSIIEISKDTVFPRDNLAEKLAGLSYIREYKVSRQGSFSIRGDIVDIFPPNYNDPVRINLFGDNVETIKHFNPLTQVSTSVIDKLELIPASEFAVNKEINGNYNEDFSLESRIHSYFLKILQFFFKYNGLLTR